MTARDPHRAVYDRRGFVGASTIPIILGLLAPTRTEVDAWEEIVGRREPEPSSIPAELGNFLEDWIAKRVAEIMGYRIRRQRACLYHAEYPWLGCHLDRVASAGRRRPQRNLQIKSVESWKRREWGAAHSAEIPPKVYAQVQTEMGVSGYDITDVGVLFGKTEVAVFHVAYQPDWFVPTLEGVAGWYCRHVVAGEPPEAGSLAELLKLFPNSDGSVIRVDESALALIGEINLRARARKKIEAEEAALHLELQKRMGPAQAACDATGELATWRESKYFDELSFRADKPEVYAKFLTTQLDGALLAKNMPKLYAKYKTLPKRSKKCRITKRGEAIRPPGGP